MNYDELNKSVGKSKVAKIFGWILLITGISEFIVFTPTYINWKSKEKSYNKEYVYSDYGNLYYEDGNDKISVEKIYDIYDEVIELNVPDKETAVMYCSRENKQECIYFDLNNSINQGILNPIFWILLMLCFIANGIFFTTNKRVKKDANGEEKTSLSSIYMLYVFIFSLGLVFLLPQVFNAVNYLKLKNDSNITTATIYSEIYNLGTDSNLYKPVSYYYVDNQKYIYINDLYIEGNLDNTIGTTFELYYNKNNPSEVSKKGNPVNLFLMITGICFIIFTTPFVFFRNKMENRINKNKQIISNQEWKI